MNRPLMAAGLVSGAAPILMGATGVSVPSGAPDWLPWLLAFCGPFLAALGTLGLKLVASMLHAKAKALREDKDKSNDAFADALDAGAEVLDKQAAKKELK